MLLKGTIHGECLCCIIYWQSFHTLMGYFTARSETKDKPGGSLWQSINDQVQMNEVMSSKIQTN